jgi:hypothetical protein
MQHYTEGGYQRFIGLFFGLMFNRGANIQGTVDFSTMETLKRQIDRLFDPCLAICSAYYKEVF